MNKNVPKLRFKEFSDEWKVYKAEELFINISDKKHNGELDVLSVTQDRGVLLRKDLEIEIKFDTESIKNYKRVKPSDFIISLRSFQGGFEMSNKEGLISPAYTVFNFKEKEKFRSRYFSYIFKSSFFIKKLAGLIYGIRDGKAISFTDFKTMKFSVPSIEEQERIANFFTILDSLIEEQEGKVRDLKIYKKGMMQKIFKQEIRFKDENGLDYPNWEEKKLSEIVNISKGQQLNKENFIPDGKYYVLNGGVNPSGYTNEYNVERETISISEGGNSCGFVNYNKEKFWSGGHCYTLELKSNEICNLYLFEVLKYKECSIMNLRVGTGLPNIQKPALSKFKVRIPCLEEQEKIATMLFNIDNIVEEENKKLEDLRQLKKGLLQQMFV